MLHIYKCNYTGNHANYMDKIVVFYGYKQINHSFQMLQQLFYRSSFDDMNNILRISRAIKGTHHHSIQIHSTVS